MFDHLGLHVRDLVKSCRFYEATLAPLGYAVGSCDATGVSFMGPPGAPALYLYPGKHSTDVGMHLAWTAKERSSVKQFHRSGGGGAASHLSRRISTTALPTRARSNRSRHSRS